MIVFVTSGLWHGAAINFIIWGGLHGLFQIFGDFTSDIRRRFKEKFRINPRLLGIRSFLLSLWQVVFTYILTCFGWIFFRANSLTDALYIIKNLFNHNTVDNSLFDIGLNWKELSLSIMCITILLLIELLSIKRNVFETISKQILPIRWAIYIAAIMWIIIFGSYGVGYNTADFIYFQF
jgi:D-alanyl-lipoteichoic acid acyltransferase DltB (MBOAT superfamily)